MSDNSKEQHPDHDVRKWKTLESEYLIRRPWLTARRDKVQLPNGVINPEYYVLEYPDWVNIIAITTDGRMVFERQYRHGRGPPQTPAPAPTSATASSPLESTASPASTWRPPKTSRYICSTRTRYSA